MSAMSLGDRLMPLLLRAEDQESAAARALAGRQAELKARGERLEALQDFTRQYGDLARAHDARALLNQHAFYERLQEALRQQADLVAQAERRAEQARNAWAERHRRTQALESLKALDAARARQLEARREQRQFDELAQRRHCERQRERDDPA